MKDEVPNLKEFDQRLRDEAHEDLADIVAEEPTSKTPNYCDIWERWDW